MDTEAHPAERDPFRPPSEEGLAGEGSRSARVSTDGKRAPLPGAGEPLRVSADTSPPADPGRARGRAAALTARLPGGGLTALVLLCVLVLLLVGRFVMEPFEIPSRSMEPGLRI